MTPPTTRQVGGGLGWGMLNSLVLRAGNVVLGVVLARLLAPADFGVFAVAITALSILSMLAELGMTADLVRRGDIEHRAPTVFAFGLGLGILLAAAMWLFAGPLATGLGSAHATPVIQVLSLTLVLSGVTGVPSAILQRRFQQSRQLAADLTSFILTVPLVIVLIEHGYGVMALAWTRVAGQLLTVALLYILSGYSPRLGFDASVATSVWKFGFPLSLANLLSWGLLSIDYVVVGHALGATILGLYVLAFNISAWPMTALAQAVRNVALPAFSHLQLPAAKAAVDRERGSSTGHRLEGALRGSLSLTWAAAAPGAALMAVLASPLVLAVYGEKWAGAAPVLAALAAFGALRPTFDLLATYLVSRGQTREVLVIQVMWAAALVPSIILGVRWSGIIGAAWAHVVVAVAVVLPTYLFWLARDGIRIGILLRAHLAPCLGLAPLALAAIAARHLMTSPWLVLLVGGGVGLLLYGLTVQRWARQTLMEIKLSASIRSVNQWDSSPSQNSSVGVEP